MNDAGIDRDGIDWHRHERDRWAADQWHQRRKAIATLLLTLLVMFGLWVVTVMVAWWLGLLGGTR